ncbi:uncharacterized protein MYCGRDRAFT_103555 [Zymoseptoria tritici IPO323]|uniref:Uncharacterized protein n=1 Tax=Zymoseptoria tritici (strain CBS 115943 / IPO323) TaxID=336722 RepID=F9X6K3_ZYMTI|nr:uncharacterized protein MYCGRDRAFT_103555 [Zymoseptoria tritici IPO323]EGP89595.1 hypothetical protein MYCGRDRAFT_103555 [Zymoseptoria tritici IPO323]
MKLSTLLAATVMAFSTLTQAKPAPAGGEPGGWCEDCEQTCRTKNPTRDDYYCACANKYCSARCGKCTRPHA